MPKGKFRNAKFFAGLIALSLLPGCINLTPDIVLPVGYLKPLDRSQLADLNASAASTIKTAKSGDNLLTQPVEHAFVLVLKNAPQADGKIGNSVQDRKLDLKIGQKFYPVITMGQYDKLAACSFERPMTAIPRLAPSNTGTFKVCFLFEDLGEGFDVQNFSLDSINWVSSEFFMGTEPLGSTSKSSFASLSRWDPQYTYNLVEPAQFTREVYTGSGADETRLTALRFVVSPTGPQIEPSYIVAGEPRKTQADAIVINTDKAFPQKIGFKGGEVEILALTEGVLAYRILSGRPESHIIMDLD